MLRVYFGNDTKVIRQSAFTYLAELGKTTDISITTIEPENFSLGQLKSLANSSSLFSSREAYLLDSPAQAVDFLEELVSEVETLATSNNEFVVIENELLASAKKSLQYEGVELIEFKQATKERFNVFSLAEAFIQRDKRLLWLLLQEAKANNLSAEEIIGTLWWQVKILRLAEVSLSASEAGVKDFPYNKAKRALKNFKTGEVESLTRSLLTLYHEAHAGKHDIDLALEKWVLQGQ